MRYRKRERAGVRYRKIYLSLYRGKVRYRKIEGERLLIVDVFGFPDFSFILVLFYLFIFLVKILINISHFFRSL